MENLCHSLTGAALARVGLGKKVPFGTTALVIAVNLPDLDSVAAFWGGLFYLHYHRGVTHSLIGIPGIALLYSGLLWILNSRRKQPTKTTFGALFGAVFLVLATHALMDLTNSYGWRPFLPFLDRWYYGDLVFIVDPYLWLILGGTIFVRSPRVNRYFLTGVLLYWTFLFTFHKHALETAYSEIAKSRPEIRKEQVSVLPRLANPFNWSVFFQDEDYLYYSRVSTNGVLSAFRAYPRNLQQPAVQAALASCPGSVMAHFARYEFFEVVENPDGPTVILRDGRYQREASSGFGVLQIALSPDLKRHRLALPCPGE